MSDYGLGPMPSFLGTYDYQEIWLDRAKLNRHTGREGRSSESGEDPDELRQMPYWQYLRTAHWDIVRRRALGIGEHRCFYCGATDHLDVHHLTYSRRGCELDEDLIVLCRTCHLNEHVTQTELDEARKRAELARQKPPTGD